MGADAWITLAVVGAVVALLATERVAPALAVVGGVVVLLLAGVISPEVAFSGFSNPAPVTVAALYVLVGAVEHTGALVPVTELVLGRGGGRLGDQLRLNLPSAAVSAFLNNTPLVAMIAPQVADWARRRNRPPSAYLMPVNFAIQLGGLVTLIGTSTTIVVSGLLQRSGQPPLGLFEITRAGLPAAAAGLGVLVLTAPVLLPLRRDPTEALRADVREFTVEMLVTPGSPLAGSTVAGAGLRHLEGVFLVEIERDGRRIAPVSPEEVLAEGDRLIFAGNVHQILDLQRMRGLRSAEQPHFGNPAPGQAFFEAVIGASSPLAGRTLREVGFRERYDAAVVAIHRAGARVREKLGQVVLHPGDVLLVLADAGFRERWADRPDFLLVAPVEGRTPLRSSKAPLVGLVALGLVVLAGTGLVPILHASLGAALALVVMGVLSPAEARRSVNLEVIVVLAASFGLGGAIAESGLAQRVAQLFVAGLGRFGDLGTLAGVLVATVVLTQFITNNAAGALMFPIAMATARAAGLNPRAFAVAVAIGASTSFLTPIGYQTNTMVYGMGGYRFGDFLRLGGPVTVAVVAVALAAIPAGWPLR